MTRTQAAWLTVAGLAVTAVAVDYTNGLAFLYGIGITIAGAGSLR